MIRGVPRPVDPRTDVVVPGWLQFDVTANQGAVFGIGQGQRALFVTVSIAAIAFIGYLFATSGRQRLYQIILGLLLAGVIGNLYDRVQFGYVRDMIHALPDKTIFGRPAFPWIFNVADSLLCAGVFLMIVYSFLHNPGKTQEPSPQTA
jgi:signal peptidase II